MEMGLEIGDGDWRWGQGWRQGWRLEMETGMEMGLGLGLEMGLRLEMGLGLRLEMEVGLGMKVGVGMEMGTQNATCSHQPEPLAKLNQSNMSCQRAKAVMAEKSKNMVVFFFSFKLKYVYVFRISTWEGVVGLILCANAAPGGCLGVRWGCDPCGCLSDATQGLAGTPVPGKSTKASDSNKKPTLLLTSPG